MGVKIAEAGKRNYTGPISSATHFSQILHSGYGHQLAFRGLSRCDNSPLSNDFSGGPEGDLRVYLERLAEAQNIQEYIAHHPFGQRVIIESDPSWGFYSRIASADSCDLDEVVCESSRDEARQTGHLA